MMQSIVDALFGFSDLMWSVEFWILNNFILVWLATSWIFWTTVGIYLLRKPVVRKACRDAMKAMWD